MLALVGLVLGAVALFFVGKFLLKLFLILTALAPFILFIFIGMIIGIIIADTD